jgi:HK97 family phage prohead protease
MSDRFENRFTVDLAATDEGKLVGYAAVFNSRSHDLGGFIEVIAPGAFERTLRENPDVLALVEHDTSKVLARTTNGSLRIAEDARGLRVEITPADTSYARDLLALVKRGDVAGMSFRFRPYPNGHAMDLRSSPPIRTLTSVELKEVSVVVEPAYPATEVSVRALEEARANIRRMRMRLKLAENT